MYQALPFTLTNNAFKECIVITMFEKWPLHALYFYTFKVSNWIDICGEL